jgi:DNA-binding ferritin-like protein (Dps family)
MGDNEADTEKIKSTFLAILKDIKKDLEAGEATADPATAEIFRQMREQMQAATQKPQRIQADDVAAMVMNMVGQATQLDDKSAELFEQLVKQVFTVNNGQEE